MASTINASNSGSGGLISAGDASGVLALQTAGTTAITVDTSQNVGIGTSSPGNKFVTASNAANSKIEIQNTSTAASTSKTSALQFTGTDTAGTLKDSGDIFVTPADNNYVGSNMLFYTRGSDTTAERMRIDSSGNVGIGTSSPSTFSPSTTYANITAITKTDQALSFGSYYQAGVDAYSFIKSSQVGSPTTATSLRFFGGNTEQMRIDSSGNLLVGGTTSPSGTQSIYAGNRVYVGTTNNDPAFNRVNGVSISSGGSILSRSAAGWDCGLSSTSGNNINFYTDNGSARVSAGYISSNGSTTAYNLTSDYRLKQNISPLQNGLETVSKLKPCSYEYIEGNQYSEGFIAHELQEVVPQAVTGAKDAVDDNGNPKYQGVDSSFLIPHLVAAIQELKAINDTQAETINALTARIVALESK